MMRQDVHPPVAPAEKRAQHPADNSDEYRAPKSSTKTIDVETRDEVWHEEKKQSVHHQDKKSKRNEDERCAQDEKHRTHKCVQNAQEQGRSDEVAKTVIAD